MGYATKQEAAVAPGTRKPEIHELALSAKLKLKNIYISAGPLCQYIEKRNSNIRLAANEVPCHP
jgi:hypothetical protein